MKGVPGSFPVLLVIAGIALASCLPKQEAAAPELMLMTADNLYGVATDPELQESITQLLEQKAQVSLTPIIAPLPGYSERVDIMIESSKVPDVAIISQTMTKLPTMVARGLLLDLTDYIAASPVLSRLNPDLFNDLRIDGRIYFVPHNFPKSKGIFMRRDLMERYNVRLSVSPTTEEFRRELQKFVAAGVSPFCFPKWVDNFQFFCNSFEAWGGVYRKSGRFVDGFQEPEMRDALAYIRQLYLDGILNNDFIMVENSEMRERCYRGETASDIDYVTNYINYVQNTNAVGKPTEMHLIYRLIGPGGYGGALNEAIQTAWVVAADTADPAAAIRLIEMLVQDPEVYSAFYGVGIIGKHYVLNGERQIVPTERARSSGYRFTYNFLSDSFVQFGLDNLPFAVPSEIADSLPMQRFHINTMQEHLGPNYAADASVGLSSRYDRAIPQIKAAREAIIMKIVVGTVSWELGMEEYRRFWDSIEGPDILRELNAAKQIP